MKRSNLYFALLLLSLVVAVIWSALTMLSRGREKDPYTISVIVSDSNDERWVSMRDGLAQAAKNNNVVINYVSTSAFASIADEMTVINRELEKGTDGMIIQMVDSAVDADTMSNIASRTALMLLETDVNPEELYAVTGPDNYEIGAALAEVIKNDYSTSIEGKRIGIMVGEQRMLSMQKRLEGVKKGFEESDVTIAWEITGSTEGTKKRLDTFQTIDEVDILISLGNAETELAVDYLTEQSIGKRAGWHLYGVGNSEKAVYYLDKGVIEYLVVPNEFNMGYKSVEALVKQLDFRVPEVESQKTDYLAVNRSSLYDEENQKILFPIVQ